MLATLQGEEQDGFAPDTAERPCSDKTMPPAISGFGQVAQYP